MDAVKSTGLARSTFYKWKAVAELRIVDPGLYRQLEETSSCAHTLLRRCKMSLVKEMYAPLLKDMRRNGSLLTR